MNNLEKIQEYESALQDKKIPILTLDHKWHCLFPANSKPINIQELEENLNVLLRRQGQLYTDIKEAKKLKNKLMKSIVENMAENESLIDAKEREEKQEENQKIIKELNEKMQQYEEELLEMPKSIKEANKQLMITSMDICYHTLKENEADIEAITNWIKQIRIELKKNIVRKQNKEIKNQQIYSYMHDVFGMEVVDLFDMAYYVDDEEKKTVEDK